MPTSFGRYTLVRRVGTGGMAEIWKAKAQGPQGFEKVLAIKKVLPHLAEDHEFIDMFVAEAKLVATLVHPNIVQVFDFGQVGKQDYFIAMEYVPGANLANVIRRLAERKARMPLEVALYVALEASKGLGYAHAKTDASGEVLSIVHRDVSPQNILVSFGGEVKVTDFGIAKVASALTRTAEGHVRGKLAYMSPEQALVKPLDGRSDLFSLGVVLFELVTGRRLFTGASSSEIYEKVTSFKPPSEETLAGVPEEVQTILRTVLQVDPDERYNDAMQFEGALAHSLGPEGIVQARHALASIVQRLFDEERKLETEVVPVSGAVPADPGDSATHIAVTQASGSAGAAESVASDAGPVPREEPRPSPTTPSGLTLAKSSIAAAPVQVLPAPGGRPGTANDSRGMLYAGIVFVTLLVVAAAFFVGKAFSGGQPTPTPFADITPPPPPINPVVTSTPTAPPSAAPTATPAETPVRVEAPTPVRTTRPVRTPAPAPTRVAAAPVGYLNVNAKPWVQVYVDGKLVASETPLRRFGLPSGRHSVRFANPAAHFSTEATVDIPANGEKAFFVDVKNGVVRPE